jgi:hypothetical protein
MLRAPRLGAALAVLLHMARPALALDNGLGRLPGLGWNSGD